MKLWIRSQDKEKLVEALLLELDFNQIVSHSCCGITYLGQYPTKRRALEVLDEIQNKLHPQLFYKTDCLLRPEEMDKMERVLNKKYNEDFIVGHSSDEIVPLFNDVVVYEMPEE